MVKGLACLVLVLAGAACAFAEATIQADNPFYRPTADLWPMVLRARQTLGVKPIQISAKNPLDARYFPLLWLIVADTRDLAFLFEAVRTGGLSTLAELAQVRGFKSPKVLFQILLVFSFPDEATTAPKLLRLELPSWWTMFPVKAGLE